MVVSKRIAAFLSVGSLGLAILSAAQAQDRWPQFRGSQSRGISTEAFVNAGAALDSRLPDKWSSTSNVVWKKDVAGRGWSSPVVWDDKVFLTTVISSEAYEPAKKGLYFGGERKAPESEHQWKVLCLDLKTGETLWEKQVHQGVPKSSIHIKSSFASETPVTDGERIYCCFGSLGIFCLDFDGNEIWRSELEALPTRLGWGAAASPVLHEGRLYFCNDNERASYLACLDAATGKEIWKVEREEKSNWSTPFIWKNAIRTEIVTAGTSQVRSYDLDGKLLWSLKGMSSITIATPYEAEGLLSSESIAWSVPKGAPYNPSTLVYHGRMYVLYDAGLFACFDSATGKEIYSRQRIPNGRAFTSSPWAYGDKIFCLNEEGQTFVIQAGDEFKILHTNEFESDDMGMASPAILRDRVLIRTATRIYCIAKPL